MHDPFICKYEQLFHEQIQNNSIKVRLFQLLHLRLAVNMAVAQKINLMSLVCNGDVDKEIQYKYPAKSSWVSLK